MCCKTKRRVRVSRTGTRLLRAFSFVAFSVALSACSVSSKISVKQNQGDQVQETEIETNGNLNSLNLSLVF